jgi:hypothetical protein
MLVIPLRVSNTTAITQYRRNFAGTSGKMARALRGSVPTASATPKALPRSRDASLWYSKLHRFPKGPYKSVDPKATLTTNSVNFPYSAGAEYWVYIRRIAYWSAKASAFAATTITISRAALETGIIVAFRKVLLAIEAAHRTGTKV